MLPSTISLHPYILISLVIGTLLIILVGVFTCIYLNVYHKSHKKRKTEAAIAEKRLIYTTSKPIVINSIQPNIESIPCQTINELPSNYRTFNLAKQYRRDVSSDSSYSNSTTPQPQPQQSYPQSFPFGTVKSKFQQIHSSLPIHHHQENVYSEQISILSTDSEDFDNESLSAINFSLESSLIELFRIELIYRICYLTDDNQLLFQIVRITPMQTLIEQCFSSFTFKIRLFTNNDKGKNKKYLSKKDPINELFKIDLNQYHFDNSYLKLHLSGYQKNDQRYELGQTVIVINQSIVKSNIKFHHLDITTLEQNKKYIQIYENRIDMIIREQTKSESEARALICLVYENERCLLQVGIIKILGIQYLLKQSAHQFHHRDQIQIKISTIIDGKQIEKRKSKLISITNGSCTYSTSFHIDYLSLDKTSICITISYRRSLISSRSKPIGMIEFGSTQIKNQQAFQHWTDILSTPNRAHVHWHTFEAIS